MTSTPLYISRDDYHRLRLLVLTALRTQASTALEKLCGELERATVLDPSAMPANIVTMDAVVKFEDLATNEVEEYTLVYPERADISAGRLSILAPVGTALIGYRTGDIVEWPTPGGIRRLKIHQVTSASAGVASAGVRAW